jgi:hypothetical protein
VSPLFNSLAVVAVSAVAGTMLASLVLTRETLFALATAAAVADLISFVAGPTHQLLTAPKQIWILRLLAVTTTRFSVIGIGDLVLFACMAKAQLPRAPVDIGARRAWGKPADCGRRRFLHPWIAGYSISLRGNHRSVFTVGALSSTHAQKRLAKLRRSGGVLAFYRETPTLGARKDHGNNNGEPRCSPSTPPSGCTAITGWTCNKIYSARGA